MSGELSPFEINRQVREREENEKQKRKAIERTSEAPDEILTCQNFALAVLAGEGGRSIVSVVKANGRQLHLVLVPAARRALLRELQAAEDEARSEDQAAGGGGLELG